MSKDKEKCNLCYTTSKECMRSELELFSVPSFQSQLKSWKYVDYFPISSLDRQGPIEFVVKSSKNVYLDLLNSLFLFEASIKNEDSSDIEVITDADDEGYDKQFVAPVNAFHSTHFKSVEISLNGTLVSVTDNMYGYKSYIQKLLSYDYLTKESILNLGLFFNDSGNISQFRKQEGATSTTKCEELTDRYLRSSESKIFSCLGRIHSELFLQTKFLPGNNELRIKFHRADPNFSLIAATETNYMVDINKAVLRMKQYEIPDHILNAHNVMIEKNINMKFPVKHIETKYFTKASGRSDLSEQNVCTGILPNKVIIGLVDSATFNGSITTNPFNFEHFSLSSIKLRVNGEPIPYEEISCDYTNNLYSDAYFSLFQTTRSEWDSPLNLGIGYQQYKAGYCLYGFDLGTTNNDNCLDLIKTGKLSLNIKLATATTKPVTIVCYLEFSKLIELSKDGKVTTYGKTTW